MELTLLLLKQIAVMFCFMAVGFTLYKMQFVSKQGSKELGNILLRVTMPCLIINSFIIEFSVETLKLVGISYLLAILGLILAMAISHFAFGKKHRIEDFSASFSNAGFIGLPLVKACIGNEAVIFVSAFVVLLNLLQWTYGVFIISGKKDTIRINKIITNPVVVSACIGIIIFFVPAELPFFVVKTVESFSNMVAPLAMLIIGIYLAQMDIKEVFKGLSNYKCSIFRLLIIPILTLLLYKFIPFGNVQMKMALMIAAAAPVGANVAVFAQQYDLNYTDAVKPVCLSTILSIISMPLIIFVANKIF